jgi:putative transposase
MRRAGLDPPLPIHCGALQPEIPDTNFLMLPMGIVPAVPDVGGMPHYRRAWVPGGTYFFTVNLLERRQRLLVDRIDLLRDAFRETMAARPFSLVACVVLPDHLHCIWTLPDGNSDIATRWRHLKSSFSRANPTGERRSRRRVAKSERGIWQRRYWEHLIRDEGDLHAHIDYIHFNPVKHGHVARVADWPYSSFHGYVRRGLLAEDWACAPVLRGGWWVDCEIDGG